MGICYNKKTIEEIVQSKYTLAKDLTVKDKASQYYHVYVWKYTSDNLALKDVKFYDSQAQLDNEKNSAKKVYNDSECEGPWFLQGQPLKWPIKTHADQGYIILVVKNKKKSLQSLLKISNLLIQNQKKQQSELRHKKVSLQMLELLYMIHLDSFRCYYFTQIQQEKERIEFQASIQIIVGDLLEKLDCLKLITISNELYKYLKVGGQNTLKKFYNQFENITYIPGQNVNCFQSKDPNMEILGNNILTEQIQKTLQKKQTYVQNDLQIQRLVSTELKRIYSNESFQNEQEKDFLIRKLFKNLYCTFSKFNILKISLLQGINQNLDFERQNIHKSSKDKIFVSKQITRPILENFFTNQKDLQHQKLSIFYSVAKKDVQKDVLYKQKQIKRQKIDQFSNIDIEDNDISIIQKLHGDKSKKSNAKKEILDTSLPFICQITQIGGLHQSFEEGLISGKDIIIGKMDKKTSKFSKKDEVLLQNGDIQDSIFLPKQLEELKIDRNLYKIVFKSTETAQNNLMITTYNGSSQFQQLQKQNVSLIINMSPFECYNYFIHDFAYKWYHLEPLHKNFNQQQLFVKNLSSIKEENLYFYNIECLILGIIEQIRIEIEREKEGRNTKPNKVVIFCSHKNMIYSGTVVVAYLMFANSFRLSFQEAYQAVKYSTKNKFQIPKIYQEQLIQLQARIKESSCPDNLNSVNIKSSYRGYEIGLYSKRDLSLIVSRYIGQLASSNQLQNLENNGIKTYFLVPNSLTSIIVKTMNILCQDTLLISENNEEKLKNISKIIKNMGLFLRLFCGKQVKNQQKQCYLAYVKDKLISQSVRYEYINFQKNIFNVEKYQVKLDLIIEALKDLIVLESVQKSFRKPQSYEQPRISIVKDIQILKITPLIYGQIQIMPFNCKETLTFKYPILRPIFQGKKKDSYYFMINKFQEMGENKSNGMGCNVTFYKGENWIGLEQDKQRYFEKIVQEYLKDVNQERIWIEDEDSSAVEKSLFDRDSMIF